MTVQAASPKEMHDYDYKEISKINYEQYNKLPHILRQYYNNYHVKIFTSKKPIKSDKKQGGGVEVFFLYN